MFFDEILSKAMKISDEVCDVLIDQKHKYDLIQKQTFQNNLGSYIREDGTVLFPENALIHGTMFWKKNLLGIKEHGILSSEFCMNESEKYGETYFMADFFKNNSGRDITIKTLLNCGKNEKLTRFFPSDKPHEKNPMVAFIINPNNKMIDQYLTRDLFSKNNIELLDFIDEEFVSSIQARRNMAEYNHILGQSSFPIGVPYSTLAGIIIDVMIERNAVAMNFIQKTFGNELFIISSQGKVLSGPKSLLSKKESNFIQ